MDDVWDLSEFIDKRTLQNSGKRINFSYIENLEIKQIVKMYAYHLLGKMRAVSVVAKFKGRLPSFIEYCKLNGIENLGDFKKDDWLHFNLWLKNERKVSVQTGYHNSQIVEDIIRTGKIKGWNVGMINMVGIGSSRLWTWKARKEQFKKHKTRPIPEDVFDKILYHVTHDEKDIRTKSGIIIQSQTGLRIEEVLSVKKGCLKTTLEGDSYIELLLSKTEKGERVIHKVFANELVKNVMKELEEFTEPLRKEGGLEELFLIRYDGGIRVMSTGNWTSKRLPRFIKQWDIRDNKGNLYPLKSHQFRATFVRELIKKKVPISHIFEQFSHVSLEMTVHYLTLQQEEIKEIYSDMILGPDAKIAGLRAREIKSKLNDLFCGKTEEEVGQIITGLAETMSFNPLPTGLCLYDFRRGNCTDGEGCFMYNCPNYITEVRFYPVLKSELDLLEAEMTRLEELGREREWQREFVKYKYLKPLVESLEVEISGGETA
jgi:integrase